MDKITYIDDILSKANIDIKKNNKNLKDDKINKEIRDIINDYINNKINYEGVIYFINKKLGLSIKKCEKILNCIKLQSHYKYNSIKNELVTVIITTYNRKEMLEEAIKSVKKQNYKNIEIVVMDDCSTDESEKYIKSKFFNDKNISYYRNDINKGPGISRSIAFNKFSNGKYIIFMDDDDFFIDDTYISKAIDIHIKNENLSFVAAETFIENIEKNTITASNFNKIGYINRKEYFMEFQTSKFPKPNSTFTAVFNKNKLVESGLNKVEMVNDSSIYLRALLSGDAFLLDNIVGVYRLHGNNITFSCTSDFIIKNLQEKFNIGLIAQKNFNYKKEIIEEWFLSQVYITITYYFYNSPTKINDFTRILKFIKGKSIKNYNRIRAEIYKIYINKLIIKLKSKYLLIKK